MKNLPNPLRKKVLIPLGLTAAASATDAALHKKMFGSSVTTFINSNEEMNNIIKIVKSLQESGLLIKALTKQLKKGQRAKTKISQKVIRHFRCYFIRESIKR